MRPHSTRWWIYSVSLTFTVAASIWVTVRGPTTVIAATPLVTHPVAVKSVRSVDGKPSSLDIPVREFPEPALTAQVRDPFGMASPTAPPVPPPVAPTPVSPPPPTAPPLPFVYRGILTASDGSWIVQLARGGEFLLGGRGDLIDSTYRLDDLKDDELIFTYLPMSLVQTLSVASDQP